MPTLDASRRPLTDAERRPLQAKVRAAQARGRKASSRAPVFAAAFVLVLWLTDAARLRRALDGGRGGLSAVIGGRDRVVWVRRDLRKDDSQRRAVGAGRLEWALARNATDVYDIRASAFVELEEFEDEGACYAFALDGGRVMMVSGPAGNSATVAGRAAI